MKFKNKFLYILCGGVMALTSCEKELDTQPTGLAIFSEDIAYQTFDHLQLGVNEGYSRYAAYANDMYMSALLSDEAKLGPDNAGQGALTYRYQYGSDGTTGGDVTGAYYSYYSLIDHVNRVLAKIPTVAAKPGEEPRRDILKGQMLALRAIGHFSLLEMYSDRYDASKLGVPVMTESCVLCRPARNTMGEVMTQIEKDLTDAKALLPAVTSATFSDTVMNKINVAGYQARIALYKREYQQAIDFATEVISSGIKPLVTGSAFAGIWTDANKNEVLFRRRYETSTAIGGLWTTSGGLVYLSPSDKLNAAYEASDIRKAAYIGTMSGKRFVNKFFTSAKGGLVVDIKAMRTAEMYLIRAEAYAKLPAPNVGAGTADLNALQTQRGATLSSPTNAQELIDAVMEERFKELAFEGFRFWDLKRNFLPVQRLASDANVEWQTLPANSFRWLMPIPRDEIIANPNTVQNPGY